MAPCHAAVDAALRLGRCQPADQPLKQARFIDIPNRVAEFRRDRMTWVAYAMLAWFAYLQASPGLVVPHLRDELHLSYSSAGLHVAAFAAGSLVAGFVSARAERAVGRKPLFWLSAVAMAVGTVLLTAGRTEAVTLTGLLTMGIGGGLLLITVQALLSD